MALRVWLPLNGDPNMLDDLSDLVKNIGISGNIIPERVGTHHSFSSGGKLGYALTFIGSASDYLCIPGLKLQTFSWACWFKCTGSTTATSQRILSEGRDAGSRGAEIWLSQNGTTLYLQAHGVTHNTTVESDKWYHVAFTCGDGVFSSYLNGNLINSSAYTANCDYAQSNDKFVIGKMAYSYTNTSNYFPFVGQINDVRIYDHCLSPLEVKEISQGLILHYKLDSNIIEATTNLIITEDCLSSTCYNGATGKYSYGTTTDMYKEVTIFDGHKGTKVYMGTNGNSAFPYVYINNMYTSDGTNSPAYKTLSFDYYTNIGTSIRPYKLGSGSGTATYRISNSNGISTGTGTDAVSIPILQNEWNHIEITFHGTTEADAQWGYIQNYPTHTSDTSNFWFFSNMQLEIKDHATGYVGIGKSRNTGYIVDSSGYGNDGVITGNVTTRANDSKEGRYNISTYIPLGSTDYITTQNPIGNPSDAITMSIWFKSNNTSPGNGYHEIFNHATSSQYFEFAIQNNGLFRAGMVINGTRYVANTAQLGLLDGNWHMLSMTYNGTTIVRYVDGISRSTTSITGSLTGANGSFLLGHYGPNTSYHAKEAYLADARIYATALSAEDIADLYHTPANIDNLGGIHGFEFEEKTPNLLNPNPKEWTIETSVTCVWNEETGYFDINTNRDTSVTSRWGVYTGVPIKPNTTYLFSAEVLDNKSYIGVAGGTSSRSLPSNIISWNGEKRYYYFFTTSSSHTHAWVYLCSKPSETTAGHFKNIYLGEVGEIASIKQNGIFENEDMVEYNENGRITKSGELAGSNFIEK